MITARFSMMCDNTSCKKATYGSVTIKEDMSVLSMMDNLPTGWRVVDTYDGLMAFCSDTCQAVTIAKQAHKKH